MFFSRSRKWKKVADAILVEVQHLISRLEPQINKTINVVSDDDYLLGFIDELCDLLINRAEQEGVKLDQVDKETILFLVIEQIYGKGAIDQRRLNNLRNEKPERNLKFIVGYKDAIQFFGDSYLPHLKSETNRRV